MKVGFIDIEQSMSIVIGSNLESIPEIGIPFSYEDPTFPGVYIVEFVESMMFSDLAKQGIKTGKDDKGGFLALFIRKLDEDEEDEIELEEFDEEEWEYLYEDIASTLRNLEED